MEQIHFPATNTTPLVSFADNKKLVIKGRSISEHEITFYKPIVAWASKLQLKILEVDVDVEYANSRSFKKLYQLLNVMDINPDIKTLIINWYYDEGDDDALIKGQIYQESLSKAKFRFIMHTSL